jgi:hypothetical protein
MVGRVRSAVKGGELTARLPMAAAGLAALSAILVAAPSAHAATAPAADRPTAVPQASGGGCGSPARTSFGSIKACISEAWPNVIPDAYVTISGTPGTGCNVIIYLMNSSGAVDAQNGPFPCQNDHFYGPADNIFRSSKWQTVACFYGSEWSCSYSPWQNS